MSRLRFNHVFLLLIMLSGACAFILPPGASNSIRGKIDGLFAPVSYPLRKVAGAIDRQFQARAETIPADVASFSPAAQNEIAKLKASIASLSVQLDQLKKVAADRELMGDAQRYAQPFRVIGGDPGNRQSLSLAGTSGDGLAIGMAAVHRDGIVGKITAVGPGGAKVRLITDWGFKVAGVFGRFESSTDGKVRFVKIDTAAPLVEGRGAGQLVITNLTMEQVKKAGLAVNDVVYLSDPDDWPLVVNGYLIGQITDIQEAKAPLYAQITLTPHLNLKQLREVMVVTMKETRRSARGGK